MGCIQAHDGDYEALCAALIGAVRNTGPGTSWNISSAFLRRKTLQDRLAKAGVGRNHYTPANNYSGNLDVMRYAHSMLTECGPDDLDTRFQKASIIMDQFGHLRATRA